MSGRPVAYVPMVFDPRITVPLEEALARLAISPMIEIAFEARPNTGVTHCATVERQGVADVLATTRIYESGLLAQMKDFGLCVDFTHHQHGEGVLFIQTKRECRLSAAQLEDSQARGHAACLFSK